MLVQYGHLLNVYPDLNTNWFYAAGETVCAWAANPDEKDWDSLPALNSLRSALLDPHGDERAVGRFVLLARIALIDARYGTTDSVTALNSAMAYMIECSDLLRAELVEVASVQSSELLSARIAGLSAITETIAMIGNQATSIEGPRSPSAAKMIELVQVLRMQQRTDLLRNLPEYDSNLDTPGQLNGLTDRIRFLNYRKENASTLANDNGGDVVLPLRNDAEIETLTLAYPEYNAIQPPEIEHELAYCKRELANFSRAHATLRTRIESRSDGVLLEDLQFLLTSEEAILDYYLGPERAYLAVIGATEWHVFHLPALVLGDVARLVARSFTAPSKTQGGQPSINEVLIRLGDLFLPKVVEDHLARMQVRRIFLVPSGILWSVPFSWLVIRGQRVFERWQVCSVPAARFAGSAALSLWRNATSNYVGGFAGAPGPNYLPKLNEELSAVARFMNCPPDTMATPEGVLRAMQEAHVVHLGCHGTYDNVSPLLSCLNLLPDASHIDGRLYLSELLSTKMTASIVNLAACHTADVGSSRSLPETLAHTVLGAGARFVIGSMWQADDEASELFNTHFYGALEHSSDRDPIAAFNATQIRHLNELSSLAIDYEWTPDQILINAANVVLLGATATSIPRRQ